jgi:cytoskeleton-associated protein 5
VTQVGDPKETIRVKFRNIFRQLVRLYPASKLFLYVMKGLESKNSRVRIECLDFLAGLVQKNGLNVCVPSKVFPAIGNQLADRDAGVRNAALGVIVAAHAFVRDGVFKFLKISEKEKSLVEERLKRLPPSQAGSMVSLASGSAVSSARGSMQSVATAHVALPAASAIPAPVTILPTMRAPTPALALPVKKEFSLDLEFIEGVGGSGGAPARGRAPVEGVHSFTGRSSDRPSTSELSLDQRSAAEARSSSYPRFTEQASSSSKLLPGAGRAASPDHLRSIQKEYVLDQILSRVSSGEPVAGVEAVKSLEKILLHSPKTIQGACNEVVPALLLQLHLVLMQHIADDSNSATNLRFCKHLINVLVVIFSNEPCMRGIIKKTLEQTMVEMLNLLIDANLPTREQGPQLTKALNVLMVRVLENADRNMTFRWVGCGGALRCWSSPSPLAHAPPDHPRTPRPAASCWGRWKSRRATATCPPPTPTWWCWPSTMSW